MRRRDFMTLSGAAAVLLLDAGRAWSQTAALRHVGVLMPTAADDPDTTARAKAFRQELERLGWTKERNIHIDYRGRQKRSVCSSGARSGRLAARSSVRSGNSGRRYIATGN